MAKHAHTHKTKETQQTLHKLQENKKAEAKHHAELVDHNPLLHKQAESSVKQAHSKDAQSYTGTSRTEPPKAKISDKNKIDTDEFVSQARVAIETPIAAFSSLFTPQTEEADITNLFFNNPVFTIQRAMFNMMIQAWVTNWQNMASLYQEKT